MASSGCVKRVAQGASSNSYFPTDAHKVSLLDINGIRTPDPLDSYLVLGPITYPEPANHFVASVLGRLAASYRWRHSWPHAIESHAATNGGFIPGGRRSRVSSRSHSGTLDIRTAVRCGRERRRKIVVATRAAKRPFQRAEAIGRRGAGPAFCGYPR